MNKLEIKNYVYAGNSIFSLQRYAEKYYYNVVKRPYNKSVFDVYLISTNGLKKCLGKLWRDMDYPFDRTCKNYGEPYLDLIEEFTRLLNRSNSVCDIPFEKGHTCARCGMLLTDEESIKRGYGPECWRKIHNDS